MSSETSLVAKNFCMQEWGDMVRKCQARPKGMKVSEWCQQYGITRDTYYYQLTQVRKACLDEMNNVNKSAPNKMIVPVSKELLSKCAEEHSTSEPKVTINCATIYINEDISPELLKMVIEVLANAK